MMPRLKCQNQWRSLLILIRYMITPDGGKLMMGQLILPTCDDHMQVHIVRQKTLCMHVCTN